MLRTLLLCAFGLLAGWGTMTMAHECEPPTAPPFYPFYQVWGGADGVSVTIGAFEVLHHNATNPMLFVGKGEDTITEFSGNFDIQSYLTERVALTNWTLADGEDNNTMYMTLSYADYSVTLRLSQDFPTPLILTVVNGTGAWDRLWLRTPATPTERVYGGGEQFTYLDLRGRVFPIWTREQGVGRNKSSIITFFADQLGEAGGDYSTTYFPQPTWLTSTRTLLHFTGSNYAVLDFTHHDFHEMFVLGETTGQQWIFQRQETIGNLVSCLTGLLGQMKPLPTWLYEGAILGVQGGTTMMLNRLKTAQDAGVSVRGLWIQDWSGTRQTPFGTRVNWDWRWDPNHYPGLNVTITMLRDKLGVRVLGYINPSLDARGNLFATAKTKGFLVRNKHGEPYLSNYGTYRCGMVDFTNPDARTWYKDDVIKKNMIDLGLGGWMADFGEYLPVDAILHSGEDPTLLHNAWPKMWAQLNHEAVTEAGATDVIFFSRSGFSGQGNATMLQWAGDQNVDWSLSDGEASTVPAALSLGLSGVGLTHHDIGGYTTYVLPQLKMVRSAERLLRSAEHAVFGPVFRTHEGNIPQLNAQFYSSPYVTACFARLVDMFTNLTSYHEHVVNVIATTGIPAQRPLFLNYPDDEQSYAIQYEYMYGDDLLVAPVYTANVTTWPVYLPRDSKQEWVFLWNSSLTSHGGETLTVPTPIGLPPVFYRQHSTFAPAFLRLGAMPPVPPPGPPPPTPSPPEPRPQTSGGGGPSGSGARSGVNTILLLALCCVSLLKGSGHFF